MNILRILHHSASANRLDASRLAKLFGSCAGKLHAHPQSIPHSAFTWRMSEPSHLGLNGGCTFVRAVLRDRGNLHPCRLMILSALCKNSVDAVSKPSFYFLLRPAFVIDVVILVLAPTGFHVRGLALAGNLVACSMRCALPSYVACYIGRQTHDASQSPPASAKDCAAVRGETTPPTDAARRSVQYRP